MLQSCNVLKGQISLKNLGLNTSENAIANRKRLTGALKTKLEDLELLETAQLAWNNNTARRQVIKNHNTTQQNISANIIDMKNATRKLTCSLMEMQSV